MMFVCLYKTTGLVSALIRWQTRSPYSHASILFEDGTVIESREFIGVHRLPNWRPLPKTQVEMYELNLEFAQEQAIRKFMESQVGKAYDYSSLIRFITRRPLQHWQKTSWFCSEIVFYACQLAGIHLLHHCEPWEVSPGILSLSPLLKYRKTVLT